MSLSLVDAAEPAADLGAAPADMSTAPGGFSRSALLFELLVDVVQRHEPQVAAVLRGERTTAGMSAALLARTLQAQGIWFQLLSIAEQNRDMRNRREAERERGYEKLRGTFANVFASAAAEGITGEAIREALSSLRVRPVDHRASDGGEARDRAGGSAENLSTPARSRVAALDGSRTSGIDPRNR